MVQVVEAMVVVEDALVVDGADEVVDEAFEPEPDAPHPAQMAATSRSEPSRAGVLGMERC